MTEKENDDIPSLVAEEMHRAQIANIPLADQPRYVADRIRLCIAGSNDYVRKRALSPAARRAEIKRRFTGDNIDDLARDYDLTPRRIRQILAEK